MNIKYNKTKKNMEDICVTKTNKTRFIILIVIIIFTGPISIADLVYGFNKDDCLNEYIPDIDLNMKKYLVVSGIIGIFTILYRIYTIRISLDGNISDGLMVSNTVVSLLGQSFGLIWNIMGAIIFWTFVYPECGCKPSTNDYLFTSLIIKLVITYFSLMDTINKV